MGYIRSNEDYFRSTGCSDKEAKIQTAIFEKEIDYGYCNPLKAKSAHEEEQEIRRKFETDEN